MSDWVINPWCLGDVFEIVGLVCDSDLGSVGVPPSVTVSDPAEANNGDLIVLHAVVKDDGAIEGGSWTVNAIWTEVVEGFQLASGGGNDTRAAVWYRIKDAGDPATNDVQYSTGDSDLYVCQYVVKAPNATKPFVYAYHADEASGDNDHRIGRCEVQPNTVQVAWWATDPAGAINGGSSTLPPTVLKDGTDEHGYVAYNLLDGSGAAVITAYNLNSSGVTNLPYVSYLIASSFRSDFGAGTRPTTPTPDVDTIYTTDVDIDTSDTAADFRYRPATQVVDRWKDQSGNANHLDTRDGPNDPDGPDYMPQTGVLMGRYNGALGGDNNVVAPFTIPQLNATITKIELMMIIELSEFDSAGNDGRLLFKYNEDSARFQLKHNVSTGNLEAEIFNGGSETGSVTVATADVSTLPYGRHIVFVTFDPASRLALRVDGFESADETANTTAEHGPATLERTFGGDGSITTTAYPNGLNIMEIAIWANQTSLTTVQKEAWETYAFNEYGITDRGP